MIKFLEVKRAYYADPENVVVESNGPTHNWSITDPEENGWRNDWQWRIRPRTIRIGEIAVPEPVREELTKGEKYFYATIQFTDTCDSFTWQGDNFDKRLLSRGLIHLTKEAAIEHAKALIIVSGGKV